MTTPQTQSIIPKTNNARDIPTTKPALSFKKLLTFCRTNCGFNAIAPANDAAPATTNPIDNPETTPKQSKITPNTNIAAPATAITFINISSASLSTFPLFVATIATPKAAAPATRKAIPHCHTPLNNNINPSATNAVPAIARIFISFSLIGVTWSPFDKVAIETEKIETPAIIKPMPQPMCPKKIKSNPTATSAPPTIAIIAAISPLIFSTKELS